MKLPSEVDAPAEAETARRESFMLAETTGTNLTLSAEETRTILGVGRSSFYELARRDVLPVPTIRVGRSMRFSRAAVEELLSRRHTAKPDTQGASVHAEPLDAA